ncbi:SDR family NAD(P)-dependent oxidoreductase [Chloroflexus sp.]|uniref:SDR family NAD(P)-dependent oxidoreductase n=1 Tax=Chloroflexus sp. TaxID=1904827 RepID=UPI00262185BF|nr:SDR family NAD(P)-dependent oxidoreductase [uncultured Chloroflexus sp.]
MRSILITGASRGIGAATALALAQPNTRLTLAARNRTALEAVATQVIAAGAECVVAPCDVTDPAQVAETVALAAGGGHLDVVVHSVGGALVAPLATISLADWEEHLRIQLTSLFLVAQAATARMDRGGLLINIASVAARQAFPGWSAYVAAKHGALGFAAAIREELRPRGIRVCSILPAATDTAIWDAIPGEWSRTNMLQPDDVAATIAAIVALPPYVTVEDLTIGHVVGRL